MSPIWLLISYCLVWVTGAFSLPKVQQLSAKGIELRAGWMSVDSSAHDGWNRLKSPTLNKGTSYSYEERNKYGLVGLVPAGEPMSLETKVSIAMDELRKKTQPLDKYVFLHTIQDSDETLFYAILTKHTAEAMPYVYTPTVGAACQEWGKIYRQVPRGLYLSINDMGNIKQILKNYIHQDIKVIVVTDGERILGLGDLGVNGMGIPIGKLALYTACAGINPSQCLPVHIDVGCNRPELRNSPQYLGLRRERERGPAYDQLIDEFFNACQSVYGRNVLIQFEDFGNLNAFKLLEKHQHTASCFNDDIQGTASVVLAGILSSLGLAKKKSISDHTFLFHGAGEAGVGIANLISSAIMLEKGCSEEEAHKNIWLVDSQGLICKSRPDELAHHKKPYAHLLPSNANTKGIDNLLDAIKLIKPSALIGVSAQGGAFTKEICQEMAKINESPLIFALSNPTSKAECTPTQAYEWTNGKCVYASGSPFDPVTLTDGRKFVPGQGNNAYIFPGVGLGALACGASTITDNDFYVAAAELAEQVSAERLNQGCAYPPLSEIRNVSVKIANAVAKNIYKNKRASIKPDNNGDYLAICKQIMYEPHY